MNTQDDEESYFDIVDASIYLLIVFIICLTFSLAYKGKTEAALEKKNKAKVSQVAFV